MNATNAVLAAGFAVGLLAALLLWCWLERVRPARAKEIGWWGVCLWVGLGALVWRLRSGADPANAVLVAMGAAGLALVTLAGAEARARTARAMADRSARLGKGRAYRPMEFEGPYLRAAQRPTPPSPVLGEVRSAEAPAHRPG